jgi:hypothetical protein
VQTFGVLLALDVDDESGNMTVRQVSEVSNPIVAPPCSDALEFHRHPGSVPRVPLPATVLHPPA